MAALSSRLIDAQETERRLLARELHDEIGQALTAVKLSLLAARQAEDAASLGTACADATAIVDRALAQVRGLSLSLRPSMLDDLGLAPAVRWLVTTQTSRAGLEVDLRLHLPERRLTRDLETTCFRVLQEAVTNVLRHARATRLVVELSEREGQLRLAVGDDGQGFDVAAALDDASRGSSLGLLSMQERVHLSGGTLEFESGASGTQVRARWPVAAGVTAPAP
jgi:signal transduction histidine kinase